MRFPSINKATSKKRYLHDVPQKLWHVVFYSMLNEADHIFASVFNFLLYKAHKT